MTSVAIASPTLARLNDARRALVEARTFSDVHKVMQQAGALREVAKRLERYYHAEHVATEAIEAAHACTIEAAEIETEAKAKAGEILSQMQSDGTLAEKGRPKKNAQAGRLLDLGIASTTAARWQSVGEIPKKTREKYYAQEKTDPDGAISTGGLIKFVQQESAQEYEDVLLSGPDGAHLRYVDRLLEITKWALKIAEFDQQQAAQHADEMLADHLHDVAKIWQQWLGEFDKHRRVASRLRSV
jgi:hypothetical protein